MSSTDEEVQTDLPTPTLPEIDTDVLQADEVIAMWKRPEWRGPEGTVASIRPNLSQYTSGRSKHKNIQAFLESGSKMAPQPSGTNRLYARRVQNVTNTGTYGWIYYNDFAEVPSDGMSLAQLSVYCGSGSSIETIEVGVQELPSLYGDNNLHFFTYFTANGYASQGDYVGGYNMDVAGFVPYTGAFPPGATIPNSGSGGAQRRFRTLLYNGAWWVQDYVSSTSSTWLG